MLTLADMVLVVFQHVSMPRHTLTRHVLQSQVWHGTWSLWPGEVPLHMSPLDCLSAFQCSVDTEQLISLDAPSAGLSSIVAKFLQIRVAALPGSVNANLLPR